jgi:hypothetical protein
MWQLPTRLRGRWAAQLGFHVRYASTLQQNLAAWEAKATKELKGKDPNEALAWTTPDVGARAAAE